MSAARGSQPSLRLTLSPEAQLAPSAQEEGVRDSHAVRAGFRSGLRLCRPEETADENANGTPAGTTTLVDILKLARLAVLSTYGPCAASSPALVTAWARRLAETTPMSLSSRLALFGELSRFADPVPTIDERSPRQA